MLLPRRAALAAAVFCAACGLAAAQSAPTPPKTDLDSKPGTLSDKLGATNGVIRPAGDVDPAMHKAAPQAGSMPVVKPGQVPPQSGNAAKGGGLY